LLKLGFTHLASNSQRLPFTVNEAVEEVRPAEFFRKGQQMRKATYRSRRRRSIAPTVLSANPNRRATWRGRPCGGLSDGLLKPSAERRFARQLLHPLQLHDAGRTPQR
jgi:hypothetical protein